MASGILPTANAIAATPIAQPKGFQFQGPTRGGSGVIINSMGYVLTNHHVVHGAKSISVTLSAGKVTKTYPASLIDEAPEFDFAILKIETTGNERFAPAMIGNSSRVSVGDEVLALGSPFGLSQTVTFGIVSNTTRTLTIGKTRFNDFFQTDAPINPGSSGGPLVNLQGEVIGINTAIYSPTQAFSGIGFASPIDPAKAAFADFIERTPNTAVRVFERNTPAWMRGQLIPAAGQIQQQGQLPWCPPGGPVGRMGNAQIQQSPRMQRQGLLPFYSQGNGNWARPAAYVQDSSSWIGMRGGDVDGRLKKLLDLPMTMSKGVVVMEVYGNSPAAFAGLRSGDVILRANNRSVRDVAMFEQFLAAKIPADAMKLTVYRFGDKLNLRILPAPMQAGAMTPAAGGVVIQAQAVAAVTPPNAAGAAAPALPTLKGPLLGGEVEPGELEALGMGIQDLSPALIATYNLPEGVKGVVITEVALQAQTAGLQMGDVIGAVNKQRIESVVDFIKVMNTAPVDQDIAFGIYRDGRRIGITMKG